MKTKRNIFIAFLLNLCFSIFEFFGGLFTGSVAIISDAVHDFGDAISIGTSFVLEKKSEQKPNKKYTYGYARFSVLGGFITTMILIISSFIVIYNAILRIINPTPLNYDGMIIFAVIGAIVNLVAAHFTHGGKSINQKAVNLHMLEDVLGWIVVLIGAIVIKFTNLYVIDPILSITVALFITVTSFKNLKRILDVFLIKTPNEINIDEIIEHVESIDSVVGVHHVHVWSLDGENNCATLHVVVKEISTKIKAEIKHELEEHNVSHVTVEMETELEDCHEKTCEIKHQSHHRHHHHHHH